MTFIWINDEDTSNKKFIWIPPFNWKYTYPIKQINANLGYLKVEGSFLNDKDLISKFLARFSLLILISLSIILLLKPLYKKIPFQLFIYPINYIVKILEGSKNANDDALYKKLTISKEIIEIENKINTILQDKQDQTRKDSLIEISTQVAHDIRSPLVALNSNI